MNERIKELYEQAHEQKPTIVMDPISCQPTHKIGNGGVPMYRTELNPDKFAELIVKECVNIARTKSNALIEKGLKYAEDQDEEISIKAAAWQLLVLAQEIKRHFGVYE